MSKRNYCDDCVNYDNALACGVCEARIKKLKIKQTKRKKTRYEMMQ